MEYERTGSGRAGTGVAGSRRAGTRYPIELSVARDAFNVRAGAADHRAVSAIGPRPGWGWPARQSPRRDADDKVCLAPRAAVRPCLAIDLHGGAGIAGAHGDTTCTHADGPGHTQAAVEAVRATRNRHEV